MIRKITYRLILLFAGLIAMNYLYKYTLFENDLQEHSEIINNIRNIPINTEVLYVGESSNQMYAETDEDKRTISELLDEYLTNKKVGDITKPASHAGIYKTLLKNVDESIPVKFVVVTLNLRSFNSTWKNSGLETPLQKSIVLLRDYPPLLNRMMLSFKDYDIKTEKERNEDMFYDWETRSLRFEGDRPYSNTKEWDGYMANLGVIDSLGNRDQAMTELACHFIKGYSFHIDTTNDQRIKDFDEIVAYARSQGWKVVFNLLAENIEKAQQLVGDDLTKMMKDNRRILIEYFSNKNVVVVDNLTEVSDEHFIDRNWTTEHYDETGRKIIAKNLADKINSLK